MVAWALVAGAIPIYPLYALVFADAGLSEAEISALFAIWSLVGMLAEVPSGAVADRFSRRGSLAAGGVLQGVGYAVWMLLPGFTGFAAGFVLWALGGALISGAQEALLYDGLAVVGAQEHYARVQGRVHAMELLAQIPAAGAATVLFAVGGFPLVGWASVGACVAAGWLASRLPEPPPAAGADDEDAAGYLATLRAGIREATSRPALRGVLIAASVLGGLDAIEEYFPLLTRAAGVELDLVPLAMLPIVLAGSAGAALGGWIGRFRPWAMTAVLAAAMVLLGIAVLVPNQAVVVAIGVFYGLCRAVLVAVDAQVQDGIVGKARATITSVAGLGVEIVGFVVFATWALGGGLLVAAVWLAAALLLPLWLRSGRSGRP